MTVNEETLKFKWMGEWQRENIDLDNLAQEFKGKYIEIKVYGCSYKNTFLNVIKISWE